MRAVLLALAVMTVAGGVRASVAQQEPFPHPRHQRVFPLCSSCHAGIETEQGVTYPTPNACRNCHDGVTEEVVPWTGRESRPNNLRFAHDQHLAAVTREGESTTCASCHRRSDGTRSMDVGAATPENCLTCHENASNTHLDRTADCVQCHVPVVEARALDRATIANFPQPPSHEDSDFLTNHGAIDESAMTCATCHARESCTRCHFNPESLAPIMALASDQRIAETVASLPAEYPTPATHTTGSWGWSHADVAMDDPASCANCHTQSSCRECHRGVLSDAIGTIPTPQDPEQQGVVFSETPTVHPPNFEFGHGPLAAVDDQTCSSCHTAQEACLQCHQGQGQPEFHLSNFRERHAVEAYGAEADCASCHSLEVFCRNCHIGSGIASEGALDVAYHTSRPTWLLGHAQAARQGLESCTTCHAQSDCMQCHAAVGAWRINPHGPNFTGTRVQARNQLACLQCHRTGPPGGNP